MINNEEKPLDWKSRLDLFRQSSSSTKNANQSSEMDKREKRALDSVFKTFSKSTKKNPQTEFVVVFTSKYKFLTVFSFLLVFGMIYMGLVPTMTIYIVPNFGMRVIVITLVIILFGMSGRILAFALYLRYYFIIFASQGIYYKKIGKPRFISWTDIVRIGANYRGFTTEVQTIKLYLKSNKKVRFNSTNYLYKHKSDSFADLFDLFKYH